MLFIRRRRSSGVRRAAVGAVVLALAVSVAGALPALSGSAETQDGVAHRQEPGHVGPRFKQVIGFYPYWISQNEWQNWPMDMLGTIAWFSANANADGSVTKPTGWPPSGLVPAAHAAGTKVVLTMTSFTDSTTDAVLADPAKISKHADALLTLVKDAGADGVNIDIEGVPKTNSVSGQLNRVHLPDYFKTLSQKLWAADPDYEISYDLPAVDWSDVWDVAAIDPYVTFHMIMGYDYYWKGSANAGSVAPLDNGGGISVRKSVTDFLGKGVPKAKLLLGVPYYGYEWPTASDQRGAATQGQGTARVYTAASDLANQHGRKWDAEWKTPWYAYQSAGQWHQGHYDDPESLGLKYDLVLQQDIGGIGVWALGYDSGGSELWGKIREKFADATPPQVSFTSPANNSNVSGTANVMVDATDDRNLSNVELHVDGAKAAEWTAPPFDFSWNTSGAANGAHQLKARAADWMGNTAETTIDVTVWNEPPPPPPPPPNDTIPPKVSILAPADGAEVKGDVAIVLDASDETELGKVRLSVDATQAAEWTAPPFRHVWSAQGAGAHKLTAEAWDAAGNRAAFEVTVKVAGDAAPKPPRVVAAVPEKDSTVAVDTTLTLVFSETMDTASVEAVWALTPAAPGTFKWQSTALIFTPSSPLATDTQYKLTLGTGAKSAAGVALESAYELPFKTRPAGSGAGGGPLAAGGLLSPAPLLIGLLAGIAAGAGVAFSVARRRGKKTPHAAAGESSSAGPFDEGSPR
jgi:spore germination protein YaaH